jgi:hypothetical protein
MSSASFAGFRVLHPAYVEDSDPLQLQQLSIFFQGNLGIIQVLPIRPEKKVIKCCLNIVAGGKVASLSLR